MRRTLRPPRRRPPWVGLGLAMVVLAACSSNAPSSLNPKGSEAREIAAVWWLMFALATAVYVIVAGFIVAASLRGRRTEEGRPSRITDDAFIWVGGIIVPALILAVLAVVTVRSVGRVRTREPGALRIEVVGKQWWWAVSYPDQGVVTANEVRVPVGRPIQVDLLSDNVIHSFWVPQLAGKVDTIPGQRNTLRFRVTEPGVYRGECAEYCGVQHARMAFQVIAEPSQEFDRWMTRRRQPQAEPASELAARGRVVFERESCAGCHAIRGTAARGTAGPDLTDFGSRRTIGAATVPNTRGYLTGWIANAQVIKPGNLMPPIALAPDELTALTEYMESLK